MTMVIRFGKAGEFLGCSGYPDCKNTKEFDRATDGAIVPRERAPEEVASVGTCPQCGKDLVVKKSRTGSRFIACTGWPDCKYTRPFSTGVPCPREGCDGTLVEKSSKRGKVFYACDNYPKCDFAVWDWPVPEPCPQCDSKILVRKRNRDGSEVLMFDLALSAPVTATDGPVGRVAHIILDPGHGRATHIVVRETDLPHTLRLVPEKDIATAAPDGVRLSVDRKRFAALREYILTEYFPPSFFLGLAAKEQCKLPMAPSGWTVERPATPEGAVALVGHVASLSWRLSRRLPLSVLPCALPVTGSR